MECELQGKPIMRTISKKPLHKTHTDLPAINICLIGAVGFHQTLDQSNATPFVTSLYEIDWLIEQKEIEEIQAESARKELENQELIEQKLPHQYSEFKDVFSKKSPQTSLPHTDRMI